MKVSLHLHEYDDKALSKKLEKEVEEAVRSAKEWGFNPYTEVREFVALWSEWLLATRGQTAKMQFLQEAQIYSMRGREYQDSDFFPDQLQKLIERCT